MAGLLTLGARAMFANQAALQTIGQIIANANTAGYSRQSVVLTTSPGQFTGAGFFGKGVDVQTVMRSHNEFLTKEAASAKSTASGDATRAEQLARMEKVFATGTDGLGYAASQFLNAMVDVTSRPSDPSARTTRCTGTMIENGVVAHAVPTARAAPGLPAVIATSP